MTDTAAATFMLTEVQEVRLADLSTHREPHYLVMYDASKAPEVLTVHGMIDRYVDDHGILQAVRLLTTDGRAPVVNVEAVSDTEWEVAFGEEMDACLVDYVAYTDDLRTAIATRTCLVVDAPAGA